MRREVVTCDSCKSEMTSGFAVDILTNPDVYIRTSSDISKPFNHHACGQGCLIKMMNKTIDKTYNTDKENIQLNGLPEKRYAQS